MPENVIITYKDKVIGGYTCIYNQGNAFLWFSAFKRKTYIHLHPDTMTIWQALSDAQEQDAQHLHFMDAGLPLKSNLYREFILGFGGKPVTKFRWFRFYPKSYKPAPPLAIQGVRRRGSVSLYKASPKPLSLF